MDFSSSERALRSLERRRPALSPDVLTAAQQLSTTTTHCENADYLTSLHFLLSLSQQTKNDDDDSKQAKPRWEGLAVGLLLGTELLVDASQRKATAASTTDATTPASLTNSAPGGGVVYMDGPRVPQQQQAAPSLEESKTMEVQKRTWTANDLSQVATWLHETTLEHLEHTEPRVRTFVAKAVGAHATFSVLSNETKVHDPERQLVHDQIVASIASHIAQGRDDAVPSKKQEGEEDSSSKLSESKEQDYSKSSTGALDDTTGWRALETNWQCLACWIASIGSTYFDNKGILLTDALCQQLEYSAVTHVNRHVRAAAIAVLEQLVLAAAGTSDGGKEWLESGKLRTTLIAVLKAGLADNWSQVRMAASVLNRVFWKALQDNCHASEENLQALYPLLVPRMCLNRFYLAQGVKLFSHQTWKMVFPDNGLAVVVQAMAPVVRYYVKMCDADNHVVREGACQAVAELAVKVGREEEYAAALQPHVPILLQALLMCFHDESWPVRDEACLACGTFARAYPEECRPELETLWSRWTEQVTDQIWSVRADAAVALGQACQAYEQDFLDRLLAFIQENLPAAKNQPKMTQEEYKAMQNNLEAHTDSQLYSCGSLAPKLKKKAGAGRIGCGNCDVNRPKQPWESTDGCLYLIRELVETCSLADSSLPPLDDAMLKPLLEQVADVCRVSHFPQSDELRATLWRLVPGMMHAVGKQRCKRIYLEIFLDPLMRNLESRTASAISKHAAATCAQELSQLVGPSIFRGRLYDDCQKETLDRVLRERQFEDQQMAPLLQQQQKTQFSPFEPPGLLDNLDNPYSNKMSPGLPSEMMIHHPGVDDDTMSI